MLNKEIERIIEKNFDEEVFVLQELISYATDLGLISMAYCRVESGTGLIEIGRAHV